LSTEYVVKRKTVEMSPKGVTARQGICVTRHTRDHFGVKSVADLTDPRKAAIFDTVGDGRGEIWIGAPAGRRRVSSASGLRAMASPRP
jgi:glycine betaine/proline transport system substrate-binding protein